MQTILGSGGPIADELARELRRNYTSDIRLVSRNPRKVDERDQLLSADLTDAEATSAAVAGSEIAYLTVGLPMDSTLWAQRFPVMMQNVLQACAEHDTTLVFFDNTYMYPQTAEPQTEQTGFAPDGRPKAEVRAEIAEMALSAMDRGRVRAVICRAPEFYGPQGTRSLSNSAVFNRIAAGRRAFVPVSDRTRRTLIWTPDASRAMALIGNTADTYGQTWHLPVDGDLLTYAQMITIAAEVLGHKVAHTTIPYWVFGLGARFNPTIREAFELMPRYTQDNIFSSARFDARFPEFATTGYRQGITEILTAGDPAHR